MKEYTIEELTALADDLIHSIEQAAWTRSGKAQLTKPTPHMERAINNFRKAIHPLCSACGQEL